MSKPQKIKNKNGSISYRIFVNYTDDEGNKQRESRSFSSRQMAVDWHERRSGQIEKARLYGDTETPTIKSCIEGYLNKFADGFGRSKNYDLARLITYDIAKLKVSDLTPKAIINHCIERNKEAKPQTVKNDVIWLRTVLKTMSHVDGFAFDVAVFDKAGEVLKAEKLVAKSKARDRRPTKAELWALSRFFYQSRSKLPMLHIMWFAIFSARRLSEITRLEWRDNNPDRLTGMVRDAKHPTDKAGNHLRFKYTASAWKVVLRQPKTHAFIFPYNCKSIGTTFDRACRVLNIDDLHFHDLRHEAVSRLFESGYSIDKVQLFSLHRSWQTLKIYTHLKPEEVELL